MCGEHFGMLAVAHKGSAQRKIIFVANLILVCRGEILYSRTSSRNLPRHRLVQEVSLLACPLVSVPIF
jgi:hypothetical protein